MRVDAVTVYKIDMKIEQLKTTSYFAQKKDEFFHRKTISLLFFPTLRVRVLLSPYHRAGYPKREGKDKQHILS